MKRVFLFSGLTAAGISLSAAVPSIGESGVVFSKPDGSKWAKITYTLTGGPAIVTMDIETNTQDNAAGEWVSIGGENVRTVRGAVNRVVRDLDEPLEILWNAAADWPDRIVKTGRIRATLTLWPTDAPPDWLVIGLESDNDVRFYASTDFMPHGIRSDHYRTVAMVMRKIPAANRPWMMGSPDDEVGRDPAREIYHGVTFSEDYYMGIYELTQAQVRNAGYGGQCAGYLGYEDSDIHPADMLALDDMRGCKGDPLKSPTWWPQSGYTNVSPDSVIGKFRSKTGLDEIDLPTEAQWEYACRAGTVTPYNVDTNKYELDEFCWYGAKASVICAATGKGGRKTNVVGMLLPNAWGLYDMHGNVAELCLDRLTLTNDFVRTFVYDCEPGGYGTTMDPVGGEFCTEIMHSSGSMQNNQTIKRGGAFNTTDSKIAEARSAARGYGSYNATTLADGPTKEKELSYNGARLCLPARFE